MRPDILRPHAPNTFGTASFMGRLEAVQLGLTQRGAGALLCPYVGGIADGAAAGDKVNMLYARAASTVAQSNAELREGSGHLLTVAPTRAGKGTGQIIPNLLRWSGSVLVIDIKGENYLHSAGCRQEKHQQKIVRFAPFEAESGVWNPLMSIRASLGRTTSTPEEEEDARYLTNLLIAPSGNSNDVFWENSARNFLEGLLLYVRTHELRPDLAESDDPDEIVRVRERSMSEVRRLLTLDDRSFNRLLALMGASTRTIISQSGNSLLRLMKGEGKTGASILSVALEQTSVWGYSRLRQVTYKKGLDDEPAPNDFDFTELRNGKTSIYLIIPPDYLSEYRTVLRVMIGMAMRQLRMSYKETSPDAPPVLFLLDEFPQLAYMRPIEEALLYLAGYDVRFWFFVQDMSQLQVHYPKSWRTFFANTGTQCFFGVSDIATANLVSEMAGTTTVQNIGYGSSTSAGISEGGSSGTSFGTTYGNSYGSGGGSSSDSQSETESYSTNWNSSLTLGRSTQVSYVGRRLITPDEVMRMHDQEQIIFMKGLKPIRATRMPWFDNNELKGLAALSPPQDVDFR